MNFIDSLPSWLVGASALFFFLTAALWALLPFAVFGIKDRLERQLHSLHSIDEQLRAQSLLLARIEEALNKEHRPN